MIREIPVDLLVPHPENCNFMDEETSEKLRRHIESTGRYEPLTVRPHPKEKGKFEVINGHNRLRILRALHHRAARCSVWEVDDAQTRLYLATLNRLSGKDVPERRALLLEELIGSLGVDRLRDLLPESRKQLEELERLVSAGAHDLPPGGMPTGAEGHALVALDFLLDEDEAREVNEALAAIEKAGGTALSRGQALVLLARHYLACKPRAHRKVAKPRRKTK